MFPVFLRSSFPSFKNSLAPSECTFKIFKGLFNFSPICTPTEYLRVSISYTQVGKGSCCVVIHLGISNLERANQITLTMVWHMFLLVLLFQCTKSGLKFFAMVLALHTAHGLWTHLSLGSNLATPPPIWFANSSLLVGDGSGFVSQILAKWSRIYQRLGSPGSGAQTKSKSIGWNAKDTLYKQQEDHNQALHPNFKTQTQTAHF